MYSTTIYNELIYIGETGKIEDGGEIVKNFPTTSCYAWKLYNNDLIKCYSGNELINLFKGLVICEREFQWHCGSTSPAAHLYQDIEILGLDADYSLADWAFQFANNEYVPFGFIRHGEKTAYEYIQWREDFHSRVLLEREAKKARKKSQLKRAKKIAEEKKEKDKANHEYYQSIMILPPNIQVETIVSDERHILYYYMPVINTLLNRNDVTIEDLEKLISELRLMKRTPFNKKVIKLIHEKITSIVQGAN